MPFGAAGPASRREPAAPLRSRCEDAGWTHRFVERAPANPLGWRRGRGGTAPGHTARRPHRSHHRDMTFLLDLRHTGVLCPGDLQEWPTAAFLSVFRVTTHG